MTKNNILESLTYNMKQLQFFYFYILEMSHYLLVMQELLGSTLYFMKFNLKMKKLGMSMDLDP